MSTTQVNPGELSIRLDRLYVPENVRDLDEEFLARLERSVKARGKVTEPVKVIDADPAIHGTDYDHVLVAGFHRAEIGQRLGLGVIPGVYGDAEHEHTDRAVENLVKKALNPYTEAVAIKRVLEEEGKSEEQAAELLGMSKHLVTRRLKLLELPDAAQRLVGEGVISLASVEPMRAISGVSPALLEATVEYVAGHADEVAPDDLVHQPLALVYEAALRGEREVFVAPLSEVALGDADLLRQDEPTLALLAEARALYREVHPYSVGDPQIRFTELEADRARAAGVLLEWGEEEYPLVTDLAVYQDLCRTAIAAGVQALKQQASERVSLQDAVGAAKRTEKAKPDDERATLEKDHRREMRSFAADAHGVNLDLGDSLRKGLNVVDPDDMAVARFFVYALLGSDRAVWGGDTVVSAIALRGVRFVIGDFREDLTKERADGSRGVLRISYGAGMRDENQARWLWKYLDGARTAGELYGRALVVIAAEQYASRLVVPGSQQLRPLNWPSHKDIALKALAKLAGPHIAPTLKALEKAVAKAEKEHKEAIKALAEKQSRAKDDPAPDEQAGAEDDALSLDLGLAPTDVGHDTDDAGQPTGANGEQEATSDEDFESEDLDLDLDWTQPEDCPPDVVPGGVFDSEEPEPADGDGLPDGAGDGAEAVMDASADIDF